MTKEQKLQRIFDEDMKDPKKKAKYEAIQDDLLHMIYVSPSVYRTLFSLNLAIPGEELSKHKDIYYIFTKIPFVFPLQLFYDCFLLLTVLGSAHSLCKREM